jgi:hypothetical protein
LRGNNEYLTDSGFVTSPTGVAEIANALNAVIRIESKTASAGHSTILVLL